MSLKKTIHSLKCWLKRRLPYFVSVSRLTLKDYGDDAALYLIVVCKDLEATGRTQWVRFEWRVYAQSAWETTPFSFDKWHGIFYMPSCTGTTGNTKAFDYPVTEHWGESRNVQFVWDSNRQHMGSESNALPTEPSRLGDVMSGRQVTQHWPLVKQGEEWVVVYRRVGNWGHLHGENMLMH